MSRNGILALLLIHGCTDTELTRATALTAMPDLAEPPLALTAAGEIDDVVVPLTFEATSSEALGGVPEGSVVADVYALAASCDAADACSVDGSYVNGFTLAAGTTDPSVTSGGQCDMLVPGHLRCVFDRFGIGKVVATVAGSTLADRAADGAAATGTGAEPAGLAIVARSGDEVCVCVPIEPQGASDASFVLRQAGDSTFTLRAPMGAGDEVLCPDDLSAGNTPDCGSVTIVTAISAQVTTTGAPMTGATWLKWEVTPGDATAYLAATPDCEFRGPTLTTLTDLSLPSTAYLCTDGLPTATSVVVSEATDLVGIASGTLAVSVAPYISAQDVSVTPLVPDSSYRLTYRYLDCNGDLVERPEAEFLQLSPDPTVIDTLQSVTSCPAASGCSYEVEVAFPDGSTTASIESRVTRNGGSCTTNVP